MSATSSSWNFFIYLLFLAPLSPNAQLYQCREELDYNFSIPHGAIVPVGSQIRRFQSLNAKKIFTYLDDPNKQSLTVTNDNLIEAAATSPQGLITKLLTSCQTGSATAKAGLLSIAPLKNIHYQHPLISQQIHLFQKMNDVCISMKAK